MHPVALACVAHKRTQQRWSALLTHIWADFMAHTEAHYKAKFVAAFRRPVLWCIGTNHSALCPLAFEVDLTTPHTFVDLELLHLDHE